LAELVRLGRRDVKVLFVPGIAKLFVALVAGRFVEFERLDQLHEGLTGRKLMVHLRARGER
jgi:hypothetical protein